MTYKQSAVASTAPVAISTFPAFTVAALILLILKLSAFPTISWFWILGVWLFPLILFCCVFFGIFIIGFMVIMIAEVIQSITKIRRK